MNSGTLIAIVVIVIVVLILFIILGWWISTSNTLKRMKVKVDESLSGIDVALTKRYDLLTKSLSAVKGYAKHEEETLTKVIAARQGKTVEELSMKEKNELNNAMSEAQKSISVLAESYPDLKANTTFVELQKQSADCEEQLQAARRIYNSNVSSFNQKRVSFPSSIVASASGFKADLEFFKAEEAKKSDVKFDF